MRLLQPFAVVQVLILMASVACSAAEQDGGKKIETRSIIVTVMSLGYDPKTLEVHIGDSVVWSNKSFTMHTATSDDEGKTFDTEAIKAGETSTPVRFEREGELKYHCKVHGKTMCGTIVVHAAGK